MRASAGRILEHYGLAGSVSNPGTRYFRDLLDEEAGDAAIVTTGFMNRDLQEMFAGGSYQLLPIAGAEAIAAKDPFFTATEIPRGLYREGSPVPATNLATVATTALLVTPENAEDLLIDKVLEALIQFTNEELRSDQAFSIFLLQCANLINTLQMKILNCSPSE